jgi:fatty-acyl-CoA synthase
VRRGTHLGHYLRNSPAYIECFAGGALTGLVHANVNYRYLDEELVQLCRGLDVGVLVYEREFAARVAAIRDALPEGTLYLENGTGATLNPFATSLQQVLGGAAPAQPFAEPAGEDLLMIATGGTTGLPKGTLWRHEDLWRKMNVSRGGALQVLGLAEHPATLAEHLANLERVPVPAPFLVLSPLMHGAGLMMALMVLARGGAVQTLAGERFAADEALDAIRAERSGGIALVGDAFAMPLLEALERRAGEGLIDSLAAVVSTGAALSAQVKTGLLRHNPRLMLMDTLGSTEASGFALSTAEPGVFQPFPGTRVLDEQLRDIAPGSPEPGMVYAAGYLPIGYYKDAERTAATFVEIDGRRYVRTGDRCTVRADGLLVLLGRDSTVINTGGEKVWTVEVERALLAHPAVRDALVVGVPHPRFGRQVVALLECAALDAGTLDEEALRAHLRAHLADYKVPRRLFAVPLVPRAANGKPDLPAAEALAARLAGP